MYLFVLQDSKTLLTTKYTNLFVGEKNADDLCILLPQTYNGFDLSNVIVHMYYTTPDGEPHDFIIDEYKQVELYKDRILYKINIDERFTSIEGKVKFYLTLLKYNNDTSTNSIILKTSDTSFSINKNYGGDSYITEERLEIIDQLILDYTAYKILMDETMDKANSVIQSAENGDFKGDKGDKGDKGEPGEDGYTPIKNEDYFDGINGKSAYELAVDNGYKETETEWLKSLNGDDYVLTEEDKNSIKQELNEENEALILKLMGDLDAILDDINGNVFDDINDSLDEIIGEEIS